jgi:divalent anion:Na+ symporter, DASS family
VLSLGIGLAIRFLAPVPAGVTVQAWTLLAVFAATIAGLVLEPLPTGAWAFLAATTVVATKTLTFSQTFSAFSNDVIWLIVVSFFFAKVRAPCQLQFAKAPPPSRCSHARVAHARTCSHP